MRIIPLSGQVLVEVLPAEQRSAGGIEFPNHTLSPEEIQSRHRDPASLKPASLQGIVRAIGAWPKLPNGMAEMPEFGIGNRVVIGPNAGLQMVCGIGGNFRMVSQDQILAVLT